MNISYSLRSKTTGPKNIDGTGLEDVSVRRCRITRASVTRAHARPPLRAWQQPVDTEHHAGGLKAAGCDRTWRLTSSRGRVPLFACRTSSNDILSGLSGVTCSNYHFAHLRLFSQRNISSRRLLHVFLVGQQSSTRSRALE